MPELLGEEIFTVEEAAAFAKVGEEKIREWFDLGLRHMRAATNEKKTGPRMWRVRKSALLEFFEANEVGGLAHRHEPEVQPTSKKSVRKVVKSDLSDWVPGGRQ